MKALKFLIPFALFVTLLSGCSTVHNGNVAQPVDKNGAVVPEKKEAKSGGVFNYLLDGSDSESKNLVISGRENKDLSTRHLGLIEFTFENNTEKWIRIKDLKVYFDSTHDTNQKVKLTSGKDLSAWYKATKRKLLEESSKKQMASIVIETLGEGFVEDKDENVLRNQGADALPGLNESLSLNAINKRFGSLEKSKLFPEDHLYSNDITIPPGFFVQKWILLNTWNHKDMIYLDHLYLDYKTDDAKTNTLKLDIRKRRGQWQDDIEFR